MLLLKCYTLLQTLLQMPTLLQMQTLLQTLLQMQTLMQTLLLKYLQTMLNLFLAKWLLLAQCILTYYLLLTNLLLTNLLLTNLLLTNWHSSILLSWRHSMYGVRKEICSKWPPDTLNARGHLRTQGIQCEVGRCIFSKRCQIPPGILKWGETWVMR